MGGGGRQDPMRFPKLLSLGVLLLECTFRSIFTKLHKSHPETMLDHRYTFHYIRLSGVGTMENTRKCIHKYILYICIDVYHMKSVTALCAF